MAEVFIAQTRSNNPQAEEWPPKPSKPVSSEALKPSDFTPNGNPISNSDAVIAHGPQVPLDEIDPRETKRGVVSVGSTETYFTPNRGHRPEEDVAGKIFGNPKPNAFLRHNNLPPPPEPINTNKEVTFTPGPPPIQNDPNRSISYIAAKKDGVSDQPPTQPTPQHYAPAPTFTNEKPTFVQSQPMNVSHDTYIPPAPIFGTQQTPPSPTMNVGNGDVQILPGRGPVMNVSGDLTIGGGGDMTKTARSEEVAFLGRNAMSIGSTEVQMTPGGDTTHQAGWEDKTLTPNAGAIGNQESKTGAIGEPLANKDLQDTSFGAIGKPKNVRG